MDKPRWKYFTVTKQDCGREMGNPDYIVWLEKLLKRANELVCRKIADGYIISYGFVLKDLQADLEKALEGNADNRKGVTRK